MKKENLEKAKAIYDKIKYLDRWLDNPEVYSRFTSDNMNTYTRKEAERAMSEKGINFDFKELDTMSKVTTDLFKAKLEKAKEDLEKELEYL